MAAKNNNLVRWISVTVSITAILVTIYLVLDAKASSAIKKAAVNETRIDAQSEDIKEIKTDVKEILRRMP